MNKIFRMIIISLLHLAGIVAFSWMITKGNPVFKLIILAGFVAILWSGWNYYKKELKTNKKNKK